MALSADTPIVEATGDYNELPVGAGEKIYEGAMVGADADGFVGPLSTGEYTQFVGHAYRQKDNSAGADAALYCRVRKGTYTLKVTLTGIAVANVTDKVYASDDGTLTLTADSNVLVGCVHRYIGTNTCEVTFTTLESRFGAT